MTNRNRPLSLLTNLAQLPIDEAKSEQAVARARAAVLGAETKPLPIIRRGFSLVLTCGGMAAAIVAAVWVGGLSPDATANHTESLSFRDVAYDYDRTGKNPHVTQSLKTIALRSGEMYREVGGGMVVVRNPQQKKVMELDTNKRTAFIRDFNPEADEDKYNVYETFRHLDAEHYRKLPARPEDSPNVERYVALKGGFLMPGAIVSISNKSGLPISVEQVALRKGMPISKIESDAFVFDAPVDQALFETKVPAGYTLRSQTHFLNLFGLDSKWSESDEKELGKEKPSDSK